MPSQSTTAGESPSPQSIQMLSALFAQGQYARCEQQARILTRQFAGHAFGWSLLGACLAQSGRLIDAVAPMQTAVALQPSNAGLLNNLGNILSRLGRLDEAEVCFRRVLTLTPGDVLAHNSLGNVLDSQGRRGEAEACYRSALALKPDFAVGYNNLGGTLLALGRLSEAETCLRRALEIQPGYAQAHGNLGTVLRRLNRPSEAEACFRRVLAITPGDAVALNNLGNVLGDQGRPGEAEACYRSALAFKPDYIPAHNNLGINLTNAGRFPEAEVCFRHALALKPDHVAAYSGLLFSLNFRSDTADVALDEARRYGRIVDGLVTQAYTEWRCAAAPCRLRVGLVSGDLREHVVSYFLEALLSEIDPQRVEVIAYPTQPREDAVSQRLRARCAAWHTLFGLTDAEAAARIHADGVHVLLDLGGHTAHNRLPVFAWRPAPVQASWLGYFSTTGITAMDYLIADPWTLPESEERFFTEKIWRLPETRLCFTPPDIDVQVGPLPASITGYVTFGCFNDLAKLGDDVVALWSRVLAVMPGSRLMLKAKQLQDGAARKNIAERFAVHGIESERLILEQPSPRAEYLAAYQKVDIALDPFPYPGGTTSAEALWMGVPVLTLAGERFLSRQGVGLMMNLDLPEWVASDPDDYLARARSHAGDLQGLSALRAGLRARLLASPLGDAKRFSRFWEQALEDMWRMRCG